MNDMEKNETKVHIGISGISYTVFKAFFKE